MIRLAATIACIAGILELFFLNRDARARTSKALWIPTAWLLINASRAVSTWLFPGMVVNQTDQYIEGSPIDATVFGVLIAAGLLVLNFRLTKVKAIFRQNLPLILFFCYCALSILWSDFPFVALKRWVKAIGDIVMVLIVLTDQNHLEATKRLFARVAFVLLPLSVLFIVSYPNLGSSFDASDNTTTYFGVTTGKNLLGMTCYVCGLVSLWSFLGAYEDRGMRFRRRYLIAYGVITFTALALIVRADSMTSLACFGMGAAVMVMTTQLWITRRIWGVHAVFGFALGIPLFAVFLDTAGSLLHALGRNTTLTGRLNIWKAVLSLQTNPLFGTGFESFWLGGRLQSVSKLTGMGISEAHNGYLEVYLNLGWIGLILLMGAIAMGYRRSSALFRLNPRAGRLRLGLLAAGVIYSLTEAGFRMLSPTWIGLLFAIIVVPASLQFPEKQQAAELVTNIPRQRPVRILQ